MESDTIKDALEDTRSWDARVAFGNEIIDELQPLNPSASLYAPLLA